MTVIYVSEAQNTNMAVQGANTFPNKLILIIQLGGYVCLLIGGCPALLFSFDTYSLIISACYPQCYNFYGQLPNSAL